MTEQQEHGFVQMVKRYFPERGAIIFTLRPDGKMSMGMVNTNSKDKEEYLSLWNILKKNIDGPDTDTDTNTVSNI